MKIVTRIVLVLLSTIQLSECYSSLAAKHLLKRQSMIVSAVELDVGDFENVKFTQEDKISDRISNYKVVATLKPKETNIYLNAYKEEIKKRGVVFPGFRAGKLPPYVMPDVRRYIISYGLESVLGELCNLNSLRICDEKGDDVPFGEEGFYSQIIQDSPSGKKYEEQRDSWKEGTDFSFTAHFIAEADVVEEREDEPTSRPAIDISSTIIDTEAVGESSE